VTARTADPVDVPEGWSRSARVLHWTAALFVLGALGLGLVMVNAPLGAAVKFDLYQWHKSWAFIALPFLVLRSLQRILSGRPPHLPATPLAAAVARLVHGALHILPLVLVATGYLLASASVIPIPIALPFGVVVPLVGSPDLAREDLLKSMHHVLGFLLAGLVALHIAAALWHELVLRDGLLRRMALVRQRRAAA
jgi:cytochrome b561